MNTRMNKILLAPLLTEKSMDQKIEQNVHVFKVSTTANKIEIKQAVETHFGVEVTQVRTVNVKPRKRRMGRFTGKTAAWKKAYVTVREGSGEIEYFEGT